MNWAWVAIAIVTLVVAAALVEVFLKRGTRKPLSRLAANKPRWDNENIPQRHGQDHHTIGSKWATMDTNDAYSRRYKVPTDPQAQAKALMPKRRKQSGKDND